MAGVSETRRSAFGGADFSTVYTARPSVSGKQQNARYLQVREGKTLHQLPGDRGQFVQHEISTNTERFERRPEVKANAHTGVGTTPKKRKKKSTICFYLLLF